LGAIQDRTSQAYIDKLKEIKNHLNNLNIEDAFSEFDNAAAYLDDLVKAINEHPTEVTADTTEFENAITDIINADYSTTVTIDASVDEAVDNIMSGVD